MVRIQIFTGINIISIMLLISEKQFVNKYECVYIYFISWMNLVNASRSAYLEIIIGPMFSGKTSKLVQIYKQCKLCNIPVLVINHSNDVLRNVVENELVNHDNIHIPCISTNSLSSVSTVDYNVILINEAQFFTDLIKFVTEQLTLKKQIYM